MNKLLYINNYKGFFDTCICLKYINLFVGEKSSGKTNILKLINFVSQSFYIMTNNFFITKSSDLGTFSDIVCPKNPCKEFEIAFMTNHDRCKALYLRYGENKNNPTLKEINIIVNNKCLYILIDGNKVKYKIEQNKSKKDKIFFLDWVKRNSKEKKYTEIKLAQNKNNEFYLFKIFSNIRKDYLKYHKDEIVFDFFNLPSLFDNYSLTAPIRNEPQKIYSDFNIETSPDGGHAPYILSKLFDNKYGNKKVIKAINEFGIESGLFKALSIEKYKNKAFEIIVKINKTGYNIINVGYGVSQILPILIDVLVRQKKSCIAMQQPEVHLHPKAQSAFGKILYLFAEKNEKKFFVETHSDYIIDRFRYSLKKRKPTDKLITSQVLFFEKKEDKNIIHHIDIKNDGTYGEKQPNTFRDFFIKEELMKYEI